MGGVDDRSRWCVDDNGSSAVCMLQMGVLSEKKWVVHLESAIV